MKHIVGIAFLIFASRSLADEASAFVETWPFNSTRFIEYNGWAPSSRLWLSDLPDSIVDVGPVNSRFDRRMTKLVLDRSDFQVYFVEPNPANDECTDGISRMYVHPAGKSVEFAISLNCQELTDVDPYHIGIDIYEIDSQIFIELAWPEPAGPRFRLLAVTAADIVEVACNDC